MPLPPPPPRPPRPGNSRTKLPKIQTGKTRSGNRLLLYGVEGIGKTTAAAFSDAPIMLMCSEETGYLKLLENGLVPDIPRAHIEDWEQVIPFLTSLKGTDYKTIAVDSIGALEKLAHRKVLTEDFDNHHARFQAYRNGQELASYKLWLPMLRALEELIMEDKTVLLLGHSTVKNFPNPDGEDFIRYNVDLDKHTYQATARWLDAILFLNYRRIASKKGKGVGSGNQRQLFSQESDSQVAKNRLGMTPTIDYPDDPAQSWNAISRAMKGE